MKSRLKKLLEELGSAAADPVHTEEKPAEHTPEVKEEEVHAGEQKAEEVKAPVVESYTLEELHEAFVSAGLDTDKYTTEYLAEQLGFVPLNEYNPYVQRKFSVDGVDMAGFGGMDQQTQRTWIADRLGNIEPDRLSDADRYKIAKMLRKGLLSKEQLHSATESDPYDVEHEFRLGRKGIFGNVKREGGDFPPVKVIQNPKARPGAAEEIRKNITGEITRESFSDWSKRKTLNEFNPYVQKKYAIDGVDMAGFGAMDKDTQTNWIQDKISGLQPMNMNQVDQERVAAAIRGGLVDKENLTTKIDDEGMAKRFRLGKKGFFGNFEDSKKVRPVTVVPNIRPTSPGAVETIRRKVSGLPTIPAPMPAGGPTPGPARTPVAGPAGGTPGAGPTPATGGTGTPAVAPTTILTPSGKPGMVVGPGSHLPPGTIIPIPKKKP